MVSTHSRLKAAGRDLNTTGKQTVVSTHSRLKAAGLRADGSRGYMAVSTHSRLKAAGGGGLVVKVEELFQHTAA